MIKELYTIREKELAIDITAGEISSFLNKDIRKSGARIFQNGTVSSASFVGEISPEKLWEQCGNNREAAAPYTCEIPANSSCILSLLPQQELLQEQLADRVSDSLQFIKKENNNFIYSGKAKTGIIKKSIQSDAGINHSVEYELCDWYLFFKHKNSANIFDGYMDQYSIGTLNFKEIMGVFLPFLDSIDHEISMPNGITRVVFLSANRLFSKLSQSFMIDKYRNGTALFSGKMGERILSEQFSLYDTNYYPECGIAAPFDDEGVVRKEHWLPLIEKGKIISCIADLRNGEKFGVSSTGNGTRTFDSGVSLSYNLLAAGRGEREFREIIKERDTVFVVIAEGGSFTDAGDFATPVQLAYLYKDGKIAGRLPPVTLKSSIQQMFGSRLVEVSKDSLHPGEPNPLLFMEMELLNN
ncbi:MAG: hypothetical protein GY754_04440 [bacterium]|nr:hypothetical protein [bacterium]